MRHRLRVKVLIGIFSAASLLLSQQASGTMIVRDYDTNRHDRFRNDPTQFVGSAAVAGFDLDFSGVARGFWATMISDWHFVSAAHSHPSAGAVLTFHHDNNPVGATSTRTVGGGMQIGSTDIWVGTLTSSIDPAVAVYPIANVGHYTGQIAYQVGLGGGNLGADDTTNFRVGRNIVSGVIGDVVLNNTFTTDSVFYFDDSAAGDLTGGMMSTPDLIPDETFLQGGDSGGPSFLVSATGDLILLGTHSFISDPMDNDRLFSGDAYLPNYRSQILASIPEPSSAALCAAICMVVMTIRGIVMFIHFCRLHMQH